MLPVSLEAMPQASPRQGLGFGNPSEDHYSDPALWQLSLLPGTVQLTSTLWRWSFNSRCQTLPSLRSVVYQQKHFEFGIFDKRVGPMWNDLSLASGAVANQVIPIHSFHTANVYFNFVLRNGSRWEQTKFRLSVNNVLNSRGIVGDQQAFAKTATYTPGPADLLTLMPGRSMTLTISPAFSPSR
jgi:hypothetical protein